MALTDVDRRLARLSVAICLGDWELVRSLRGECGPGEPDRAWREAVLQVHLFAGFPRVVRALDVLAEAGGLGALEDGEADWEPDDFERGRALFERIYADGAERVRAGIDAQHPVFGRWIEGHAYGRVLSRPGLAADRRELLAVACLAALGQERQLASHVRGAVRCGAAADEPGGVLDAIADLLGDEALERSRRVVERFR
ncbi:MAG: carboxymuconolactone decarboxylase family protein [Planctomycetota bacterium]|nr:carboxymuconolactone decarboxylase family protein [Planctomycetota bacterium]